MASTLFLLVLSFSAQEHTVWFFVVYDRSQQKQENNNMLWVKENPYKQHEW